MTAHRLALLAALAACGSGSAPPDAAVRADRVHAAVACLRASARSPGDPPPGCELIYREPICRAAWDSAVTGQAAGGYGRIARACRVAYCPILPKPRPAICTHPRAAAIVGWTELDAAIRRLELGALVAGSLADAIPKREPGPPPAAAAAVAVVEVVVDAQGIRLGGAALTAAELTAALRASGARVAVIRSSSDAPYQTVLDALDAIKAAGITDLRLEPL